MPSNAAARAAATVSPEEVKAKIAAGAEFAFIDLREEGVYANGHPLFATTLPLSHLETRLAKLIPRRSAPIVVYDDGDGLVERALVKFEDFGYTGVATMRGGTAGWADAGFELFSGMNVPSKALAEAIEHHHETPRIEASDLKRELDAGADILILDSRPIDEYTKMSIPGAVDCPGAELVHRAYDLIKNQQTLVVVNCAGRTRSIIGAQSLINSGLPNPVVALKDGTMGWQLAGLELAHGAKNIAPKPGAKGLSKARRAASRVAARFNVPEIDLATLGRFRQQSGKQTLYIFDVRGQDEYAAGHIPDARSAPGGQLVQATDRFVGVRNARIVLVDDDGVRAKMTASWLVQLGVGQVYVLNFPWKLDTVPVAGPEAASTLGFPLREPETIASPELSKLLETNGAVVVDLDTSLNYRRGHIPGARFAIRSRLRGELAQFPAAPLLVLTSSDGAFAALAAEEASEISTVPVRVLSGGTNAWKAAGLALETGTGNLTGEPEDIWYKPHERTGDSERVMREYLAWETGLNAQLLRDGDAPYLHLLEHAEPVK